MATITKSELGKLAEARLQKRLLKTKLVKALVQVVMLAVSLMVVALIATIIWKGGPSAASWEFVSQNPKDNMSAGGIWPMIRGSLLLLLGTFIVSLPLGFTGGMFLAEFSDNNRFVRFIRGCTTALAGTPSIIFGLFGMTLFLILPRLEPYLLAGCMTLAIMATPVIALATEQAVRAVPNSLVEGAEALGLNRVQVLFKIVIPNAIPGIATGLILAVGRAAGEAPPILLTAGIFYSTGAFKWSLETLRLPVENLPYHLTEGLRQSGTIPENIIWGTCLLLMGLVLIINLISIIIRNHFRKKLGQQ